MSWPSAALPTQLSERSYGPVNHAVCTGGEHGLSVNDSVWEKVTKISSFHSLMAIDYDN